MTNRFPDRHLSQFTTTLHPTAVQTAALRQLGDQVSALHLALNSWSFSGGRGELRALIQAAATGAPVPATMSQVLSLSTEELASLIADHLPSGWKLPEPLVRGVASQHQRYVRRWRDGPKGGNRRPSPPRELHLSLDGAVTPAGCMHVHVEGMPELLLADLWHLPLGLANALAASGSVRVAYVQDQLMRAQNAAAQGYAPALGDLRGLAERYGPLLSHSMTTGAPGRDDPQRAAHASLFEERLPTGERAWRIRWSLRVPQGWLPPVRRQEVVGVDVGIQHVVTWFDGTASGVVCGDPQLTWPAGVGSRLADALVRRSWFERTQPDLDLALRHLLSYRDVAIEGTRWEPLARQDPGAATQMHLSGAAQCADWLEALGPVTGTRVTRVPPEQGSHRCAPCRSLGIVEGRQFRCLSCGHAADRDENSAAYYRSWWLRRRP